MIDFTFLNVDKKMMKKIISLFIMLLSLPVFASKSSDIAFDLVENESVRTIKREILKNSAFYTYTRGTEKENLLMAALKSNRDNDVIKLLLDSGVSPTSKTKSKVTALMYACKYSTDVKTIKTVLSYYAPLPFMKKWRILKKDADGKTCFDYAKENPNKDEILDFLSKYASDPSLVPLKLVQEPTNETETVEKNIEKSKSEEISDEIAIETDKKIENTSDSTTNKEKESEVSSVEPQAQSEEQLPQTAKKTAKFKNKTKKEQKQDVIQAVPENTTAEAEISEVQIPVETAEPVQTAVIAPVTRETQSATKEPVVNDIQQVKATASVSKPESSTATTSISEVDTAKQVQAVIEAQTAKQTPSVATVTKAVSSAPAISVVPSTKTEPEKKNIETASHKNESKYLYDYASDKSKNNLITDDYLLGKSITHEYISEANKKDSFGRTKLMTAAKNGDLQTIENLLYSGAEIDLKDNDGWTALMYAVRFQNNADVVRTLLLYGASYKAKNNFSLTPLLFAATYSTNTDIVSIFLDYYSPNSEEARSAFIYAITNHAPLSILNVFVNKKVPVNVPYEGKTPLMYACESNRDTKIIGWLLTKGASKYQTDSVSGKTAFDFAKANTRLKHDAVYWSLDPNQE